ncbi:DNA-binding transcriptional MerR regulator [Paenibacillus sp. PvR052]|nr:DNA-binding transcriptional MerR regulator [Paenibacillus sp. PvP091]MBP1172236.1 DNA-binding transcriptional MerR regulator [Paenibacillus sp. PvR098]MBP2438617.1 DNA-binding transcriptional MerR regulator [Paenibacillus sp. PvP052]
MEYTVQKLALLAGVSTRTLRYYDEIGLLKPARINTSGYRIYGQPEVDRLQQILFYRELGVGLEEIKDLITSPSFDADHALRQHRERLLEKRKQLDALNAWDTRLSGRSHRIRLRRYDAVHLKLLCRYSTVCESLPKPETISKWTYTCFPVS